MKDFPEPNYLRLLCNVGGQTDCSYTNINEKKKKKKRPRKLTRPNSNKNLLFLGVFLKRKEAIFPAR